MDDPWEKLDPDGHLRETLRQQGKLAAKMHGALVASSLAESIQAIYAEDVRLQVERLAKAIAPLDLGRLRLPSDLGSRLQAAWEAGVAPNWHDLEHHEVFAAVRLMVDEGLNLAWAPRAEVVRELLRAADTTEREAVLVARAGDVLDDVEAQLVALTWTDLADTVDAVHEAAVNCRDGRHRSCIALVAVVVSGVIHGPLGHPAFSDARKAYEHLDPDRAALSKARLHAVLRCLHRAILRTEDWPGSGFNRHAAAHGLDAGLYTQANAVAALLLVVGLLRELDEAAQADAGESEAL